MGEAEKLKNSFHDCDIDSLLLMTEAFLGYKYRKRQHCLYSSDAKIPINLIKYYYTLHSDKVSFDNLKKAFITRYVNNESKLEGVHEAFEIEGLRVMYEYIHSDEIDYMFNVYTLKELHEKLFSKTEFPECAGNFRNWPVYLPGTGTELCDWRMIRFELNQLDSEVLFLREQAKVIRDTCDTSALINYLGDCVILGCKMIKIHPFGDGNGRTVRGFVNKLLEDAGLPPVYIKANERTEYHAAMNKANNDGDYSDIKNFYLYKICDSIIELDINERVRKENAGKPMVEANGRDGSVKKLGSLI